MFRLNNLMDDSVYLVCVITQGSSFTEFSRNQHYLFSEAIRLEDSEQFPLLARTEGATSDTAEIPSSNDTRYLITKPTILNLDSESSRCNKIKTPLDPTKLRIIDNKQLSALIGCSSGLMIFFCIIISIIVAKPKRLKEEEVVVARSSSLTDSFKSPSYKSRSDSLVYDKTSYCNSQSSSLTRLNGPDHEVRIRKDGSSTINKNSNKNTNKITSECGNTLNRNKSRKYRGNVSTMKSVPQQSSTESGPSSLNKASRQSSLDMAGAGAGPGAGQQQDRQWRTAERPGRRRGETRRSYEAAARLYCTGSKQSIYYYCITL